MDAQVSNQDAHADATTEEAAVDVNRTDTFGRFFDTVHEGVYIGILGPGASVTEAANPHLKLTFGYPSGETDRHVTPFDPDRFVDPQARALFLARLEAESTVASSLLRLRKVDGAAIWLEVTANAEVLEPGRLRVEAIVRDVSARKKLDDQARDVHQQLLQAEKLAALGQAISGVAHELNNPLATILSWSERLAQRSVDDPVRHGLEIILGEAERAARIVRNLLTFARKRQSTRALVDLNQVVRETLALRAHEQHVTHITVIPALAAGLPQVFADGHQLKQVLLNLMINAEQAMLGAHGRGRVVVRTWHDADRDAVVLEVNDDGPGIPEEMQGRIFDPFFTTKSVGKGTGLGLTVAYAIVQEHGGRIRLDAAHGRGTSFFVELPVTGASRAPSRTPQTSVSLEAFRGARVLVIEDEPALASAVAEALTDAGFVVNRAGDGEEGLALVRAEPYDLVVCDLKMPRMDGMAFYRAMAAGAPALARRVIFVTGDVAGTEAERFLDDTGCRWLSKPFRLGELLRAARDTLS